VYLLDLRLGKVPTRLLRAPAFDHGPGNLVNDSADSGKFGDAAFERRELVLRQRILFNAKASDKLNQINTL
jgi:hypothetical protein